MVRMMNRAWGEKRYQRERGPEDDALVISRHGHDSSKQLQGASTRPPTPQTPPSPLSPVSAARAGLQSDMYAEMERDYMNLISSLQAEQRRVEDLLEAKTIEKNRTEAEVDRLQRELQETKSAASHMSKLEADLERFKVAVRQRDDLIGARNEELEGLRMVVNLVTEEKAACEEKAKADMERRDSFQSVQIQKLVTTVAEKEEYIQAKDEEIQAMQSHLSHRKKERDELRQEVDILKIDLETEQREIDDLKKTMAGYRLEIRRLKALAEEERPEDEEATKKVDEIQAALDKKTEDNAALSKKVDDLLEQLNEETNKTSNLMSEIADLKSELDAARESIPEEVQQELSAQKSKIVDLEAAISRKDSDIKSKVEEIASMQTELTKNAESSSSLRQDLEETKARLEEKLERATEARNQAEQAGAKELQELQDELEQTKKQLQNQKDLAEDLQMQVGFMEEEANESSKHNEEEIAAVREVLEETKSQLQDKSNLAQSLQAQINTLQSEEGERAERFEEESSALREVLEETKEKLRIETNQTRLLQEQIQEMEAETMKQRNTAQLGAEALKESHEDAMRKFHIVREENDSLKASTAEKDAVIEAKSLECESLESMLRAFEEEQGNLSSQLQRTREELSSQNASGRTGSWRKLGSQKDLKEYESTIVEKDKCIEDKSEEIRSLMTDLQKCMEEREAMSEKLRLLRIEMESKTNDLVEAERKANDETNQVKGELADCLEANTTLKKEVTNLKDQLVSESMKSYRMRKEIEILSANHDANPDVQQLSPKENVPGVGNNAAANSFMSALEKETERKRLRMSRLRGNCGTNSNTQSQSFDFGGTNTHVDELKTEVGDFGNENDLKMRDAGALMNAPLLTDQKVASLEASLKEKEAKLEEKTSQVNALETQIKEFEANSATHADSQDSNGGLDEYKARIDGLEKDLAERDSIVIIKNQEIGDLQSSLEGCTKEKQDLDNEITELKNQLEVEVQLTTQIADSEKKALKRIEELEEEIEEREEEIASLAMGGVETECRLKELNALKEQLVDESKRAYQLSKEIESLQADKNQALDEIVNLKDAVAEKQSYIDSYCNDDSQSNGDSQCNDNDPQASNNSLAKMKQENEALKQDFEVVTLQLENLSAQNASLKSQVDALRSKDIDVGRKSAVFRARAQPWAKREGRDDFESTREQRKGDRRYEQDCSSQDSRDVLEASAENESLRRALHDAKKEKADLDEAVRNREKYVAELEFKTTEYSKKIMELKQTMAEAGPGPEAFWPDGNKSNLQKALALKEKEVERLRKDMVSLKMLASSKFRELESRAARAMDHEEQAQALRVALEKMKAAHRDEIERLTSQQLSRSPCDSHSLKENKGIRESKLQHNYEHTIKKTNEEKDLLRREVVALTTERKSFLDKIKSLEQRDVSSNSVPLKMMRSENDALKKEVEKLKKERKLMTGKLQDYELV